MKRPLFVLLLGLTVGAAAHFAYLQYCAPMRTDTIEGRLAWMRTELRLTDAQFARIKELHEASHPQLRAMSAEVVLMKAEFADFERSRRTSDRVDFIEFARFVETQRELNRRCADSTRRLVLASAEIMTAEQREHYLRLVNGTGRAEPRVFN